MPPAAGRTAMSMIVVRRLVFTLLGAVAVVALAVAAYAGWIAASVHSGVAAVEGTRSGLALQASVRIVRDDRDVPHIKAQNVHDLFFAQGYVTASDRLFQIDLTRRFVLGRLSELLGGATIAVDESKRTFDARGVVDAQFARLGADEKALLQAYADGVNAAATREPLPPEYHALFASFAPWRAQDALVVGFATVLDLADGWNDVINRDAVLRAGGPHALEAFYPLTDPKWDAPTLGGTHIAVAPLPALSGTHAPVAVKWNGETRRETIGSNEWVAGAARTTTGRALLANDPHLDRAIPGIWHLIDLQAPGFHAAGATLAGTPGVILGHNEHLAWGSTNGTVAAPRVYNETFTGDRTYKTEHGVQTATERMETFHVRFGADLTQRYLQTRHGFVIDRSGPIRRAVQWSAAEQPDSPVQAFLGLDRAASIEAAERALATYPGPTQNFVLADTTGRAAYTLAGAIPDDPAWGLRVYRGESTPATALHEIPFDRLPHRAPGRDVVAANSNNLQYGDGYPLRLSPSYAPPYRGAEITARLAALAKYSPADFVAIQSETLSFAEREFARFLVASLEKTGANRDADVKPSYDALVAFDGHMEPESRGASVVQRVRFSAARDFGAMHFTPEIARAYFATAPAFTNLLRALRERPRGWFPHDDPDAFLTAEVRETIKRFGVAETATPFGDAYAVVPKHPLSAFGFTFWNGPRVPGRGGSFAPAVQASINGQSFRAVWDVGNWDGGGIDIPLGESGEPGSPHYTDLSDRYVQHMLTPLPFSDAAVVRAARRTELLTP